MPVVKHAGGPKHSAAGGNRKSPAQEFLRRKRLEQKLVKLIAEEMKIQRDMASIADDLANMSLKKSQ